MALKWRRLAAGGREGATVREYGVNGSWSQKYSLVWDAYFDLDLFTAVREEECAFYMGSARRSPTHGPPSNGSENGPNGSKRGSVVRQAYGWFLDDRSEADSRHLTNAGWSEWTAAMCGPTAVGDLYGRIRRFAEETPDRWALTDYYNAVNGSRIRFEGRAQMGGFGASLVLAARAARSRGSGARDLQSS
jgi:hypothetical protein